MTRLDASMGKAELEVAETIGQLVEFWGFKRPMGRMWTVLFLSARPLGAAELSVRLKMSAGAVSMVLNELLKWGAVKKTWRPGERRDYFEAETSIWKLVCRVLRERELRLVREAMDALSRALQALPDSAGEAVGNAAEPSGIGFTRSRVQTLLQLARVGEQLLTSLESGALLSFAKTGETKQE